MLLGLVIAAASVSWSSGPSGWSGWSSSNGYAQPSDPPADLAPIPCRSDSVKFAVLGDFGDGGKEQYLTAARLNGLHTTCAFDFVITVGDNIYGGESKQDFVKKFEEPYKPLLAAGVLFYASLGNHDDPNQRFYKPFNMNEQRYYTFSRKGVQFFALDSNYMDRKQLAWIEDEMKGSKADWKLPYFHHPLYSSGGTHGSTVDLRSSIEPLFLNHAVQVVFSGHDHFYERIKAQKGIYYFVAGSGGKLRKRDVKNSGLTAAAYDGDRAFMIVEVAGDAMFFEAVAGNGKLVDAGCIPRTVTPSADKSRVQCPAAPSGSDQRASRLQPTSGGDQR
jgi:predicted phosphodiesterase